MMKRFLIIFIGLGLVGSLLLYLNYYQYSNSNINNFANLIGISIQPSEIKFQKNSVNAIYDQYYFKAVLTSDRAKNIHRQLMSMPDSQVFPSSVEPSDMAKLGSYKGWTFSHIEKYEGRSFDAKIYGKLYHCMYLFDYNNSEKPKLYLYGIYSAQ